MSDSLKSDTVTGQELLSFVSTRLDWMCSKGTVGWSFQDQITLLSALEWLLKREIERKP